LSKLATNPRNKSEKLSETTKSYLKEVYIERMFGRKKEIDSKFLEKGTTVEEDSLSLATRVSKQLLIKNREELSNDFITGTPDVVVPVLRDIKSAWDIFTFGNVDECSDAYLWQLMGYMALTGQKKAILTYCLVNTPEGLIYDEVKKKTFYKGIKDTDDLYVEISEQIEKNMTYNDIADELKVKEFTVEFDEEQMTMMYNRIIDAREYLNSMTL
jgi:hypothetical protein